MEVGSLFNSGILGQSFNWWIGQIADDSTWRENINAGKFEDKEAVHGWGYRYKVKIMGYHDQSEAAIKAEQLPWAQVMFPITAGGGAGGNGGVDALTPGFGGQLGGDLHGGNANGNTGAGGGGGTHQYGMGGRGASGIVIVRYALN